MNSTLKQHSVDTRLQPFPALYPGLIVRDIGGRLHRLTPQDASVIARMCQLRTTLNEFGQTLRDLMLHGY